MNLIVNRSGNTPMVTFFEQMLKNSPPTDTHLFLGYGYVYHDPRLGKLIVDWMMKDEKRVVIFVVGIHGRHKLDEYEKERMKRDDEPSVAESNSLQVVDAVIKYARQFSFSSIEDVYRLKTAAVYRFHAKICALMQLSGGPNDFDDLYDFEKVDPSGIGPLKAVELIMGSTNFTGAGMDENLELDMHVPRGSVTPSMACQVNNLISVAANSLKKNALSKTVTEQIEEGIKDMFYKRLREPNKTL
jgi:hypothetical protein